MRNRSIIALWLALAAGLPGCEGGGTPPAEAKHVELTDEQKAEIEKADRSVEDEEQGRKITQPRKGGKPRKG
jgi:hypothetical protein